MAQREIRNIGVSDLIEKRVPLKRKIPIFISIQELNNEELTKTEYLAVAQSYNEMKVWETLSWEERKFFAPILNVQYDHNNAPILTLPRFEPLCSETEANRYEESEIIEAFHCKLNLKGLEDYQIGKIIEGFYETCRKYDLNCEDIIENLSNIGWHPIFGCRIIDYGLSNEIFYNYTHWED